MMCRCHAGGHTSKFCYYLSVPLNDDDDDDDDVILFSVL